MVLPLQGRLEDENHGSTEDQHPGHYTPKDLTTLLTFRTFKRVPTVARITLRTLTGMLLKKRSILLKKLFPIKS